MEKVDLKTGLSVYGEGGLKNWVICIWRWIKILGYLYMEKVDIKTGLSVYGEGGLKNWVICIWRRWI